MPPTLRELRQRLASLDEERGRIVREIESLRERGEAPEKKPSTGEAHPLTPSEKVTLFLELFGARRSVYPKFWRNAKTGKKGYAPACDNEWRRGVCEKPRVKCAECKHQRFPALDEVAMERHLRGEHTIGVYAIREDNGCVFLASDFDGEGWRAEVAAYRDAARMENYAPLFSGYELVLVDECHHVPAVSFEAFMKSCTARRIVGLTATPVRKDRLERLLYLQCGPIRHVLHESSPTSGATRIAHVRQTGFRMSQSSPTLHEIWDALTNDVSRNELIVTDIHACLADGRCLLMLSDRKAHLEKLESLLSAGPCGTGDSPVCLNVPRESMGESPMPPNQNAAALPISLFRLDGDVGKRAREKIFTEIKNRFAAKKPFVLLATASLIGEGFDLPQLDTLFLAMPLSFKGRLVQYAGRLHRTHEAKREVRIHDYLDDLPITRVMFRRRSGAYRDMAYRIVPDGDGETEVSDVAAGQMGMGL